MYSVHLERYLERRYQHGSIVDERQHDSLTWNMEHHVAW